MERIAIIGMGASGAAVIAAYAKANAKADITCYDTKESFGRGYPYREDTDHVLLNLKTRKISYNYKDNDDLMKWLEENNRPVKEYTDRSTFGEYLRSRSSEDMEKLGAKKIFSKVCSVDYLPEKEIFVVETEDGETKEYDRVHLCAGEIGNADPYNLEGTEGYIHAPYPLKEKLASFSEDDEVVVLGSGLTAADIATVLLTENKVKHVTLAARSGVFPTVRVDPVDVEINVLTMDKINQAIEDNNGTLPFSVYDDLILRQLEAYDINYEQFIEKHNQPGVEELKVNIAEPKDLAIVQALLPPLNVLFNKAWVSMSDSDRKKFRKKYHPFMCLNRSPLPQCTAEELIEAADAGRFDVMTGVQKIEKEGDAFIIKSDTKELLSRHVVNGTGLDTKMRNIEKVNPLLADMLDKRIVQRDEYGGFIVLPEYLQAVSPRYGTIEKLHVHGVLVPGVQYRNNSTLIMQMTADKIAEWHTKK